MEAHVFLAVLAAALCHAGWNAGLKGRIEPAVAITLISIAGGIIAAPLVALVGLPKAAAWPFLAASVGLHLFYYISLAEAYRAGDLGHVYPIARGTAPLITALSSVVLWGDELTGRAWAGVLLLTGGVLLLSLFGGRGLTGVERRAVLFALATAATISAYTLVDGLGGRAAGSAHAYAVMLFVIDGAMMVGFGLLRQGAAIRRAVPGGLLMIFGGGLLSLASYWVAIWAMSVSPVALVAAVRETSVLFAAALSVLLLGEPLIRARLLAAVLVVGGLVLIRLN